MSLLLALLPLLGAGEDPDGPKAAPDRGVVAELALRGYWSGVDPEGNQVGYLFREDGTATLYRNETPALGEGAGGTVTWLLELGSSPGELTLRYSNPYGGWVEMRHSAAFTPEGDLLLGGAEVLLEGSEEPDPELSPPSQLLTLRL